MTLSINKCRTLFFVMLSVIVLSVIMLSVIMLMLLRLVMLSVFMQNCTMPSDIMISFIMLSFVTLNVIIPSVVMPNVIMLNVEGPFFKFRLREWRQHESVQRRADLLRLRLADFRGRRFGDNFIKHFYGRNLRIFVIS